MSVKKKVLLIILCSAILLFLFGCSAKQKIVQQSNNEAVDAVIEDKNQDDSIMKEEEDSGITQRSSLDWEILYHYLDGDTDFLLMKMGKLPFFNQEGGKYYEVDNYDYKVRYWIAENDYSINKISVIKDLEKFNIQKDHHLQKFMGIWLDMTMEEAAKSVTNIPEWRSDSFDLKVEYSDHDDGMVYRIDVYSNKPLEICEHN